MVLGIREQLRPHLRGDLVAPGDAGYDSARKVYNADIDRKPLVLVQCADVADVIHSVNFARGTVSSRLLSEAAAIAFPDSACAITVLSSISVG